MRLGKQAYVCRDCGVQVNIIEKQKYFVKYHENISGSQTVSYQGGGTLSQVFLGQDGTVSHATRSDIINLSVITNTLCISFTASISGIEVIFININHILYFITC